MLGAFLLLDSPEAHGSVTYGGETLLSTLNDPTVFLFFCVLGLYYKLCAHYITFSQFSKHTIILKINVFPIFQATIFFS